MTIKTDKYESLAYRIVQKGLDEIKKLKEEGYETGPFDADHAISNYLPRQYDDDQTKGRGWTRHNQSKLKKFIKAELRRRELMELMNKTKPASKPEVTRESILEYLRVKGHEHRRDADQLYISDAEESSHEGAHSALEEMAVHFGLAEYGDLI